MNELISAIIGVAGGGGIIMALIKSGLIKIQIGKNGNGTESIRASLDKMETNDLVHLDGKLDKVIDKLDKLIEISQKVLYIIEDTKR